MAISELVEEAIRNLPDRPGIYVFRGVDEGPPLYIGKAKSLRERVGGMLARAHAGRQSAFYISLGDGPLARVHYIVATVPGQVPEVDEVALETAIAQASRSFRERITEHRDANGELVVTARGVGVTTERPVDAS